MEKIDIHNSQEDYNNAVILLKKQLSKRNYELIIKYLDASSIGKTARKNARLKQSGVRSRLKNLYLLKIVVRFLNKPLDKVSVKDMEKLIKALNEDKIRKATDKKYSEETKSTLKKTFMSFLRYHLGETRKYGELTNWIETRFKRKEIPALLEPDIKKLLSKCITLHQKTLIALLFDSGCRIEEFLNIRLADVIEVKGDVPYYRVTIREEYSKTKGRTISLLWKETTPILREWLEQHPSKDDLSIPLFPSTYAGCRRVLYKVGKRALGKSVNPHLFRHGSATYYAGKGFDYFQLCKRYGWSIGSTVPHIYIDKAGIKEQELVEKFKTENLRDLEIELERLKEENKIKNEQFEELKIESSRNFKLLKDLSSIVQIMLKAAVSDKKTETYFKKQLNKIFADPRQYVQYANRLCNKT